MLTESWSSVDRTLGHFLRPQLSPWKPFRTRKERECKRVCVKERNREGVIRERDVAPTWKHRCPWGSLSSVCRDTLQLGEKVWHVLALTAAMNKMILVHFLICLPLPLLSCQSPSYHLPKPSWISVPPAALLLNSASCIQLIVSQLMEWDPVSSRHGSTLFVTWSKGKGSTFGDIHS